METPGLMLKREREARGMTLMELARVTRIPVTSLENIEKNDFDAFPAAVFVRGFLRNYARQLSIPTDEIIEAYETWVRQQAPKDVESFVESATSITTETADNDNMPIHSMRFAYIAIALIAFASVGLSLLFMGTGEAEEGDVDFMVQPGDNVESPFLISNTSEGWVSE